MAKRMLIDATHPEETRVAVVDGKRLEEFDVEVASRKQLKGNIYLAKITRVEPSLQAAFVEYGGNRHGFLAFSEIHPDYYRIPLEDREALLAEQAAMAREQDEQENESEERHSRRGRHGHRDRSRGDRHTADGAAAGTPDEAHDDAALESEMIHEEMQASEPTGVEPVNEQAGEAAPSEAIALEAVDRPDMRLASEPFEPQLEGHSQEGQAAADRALDDDVAAPAWPAAPGDQGRDDQGGDLASAEDDDADIVELSEVDPSLEAQVAELPLETPGGDDAQAQPHSPPGEEAPEHRSAIEEAPPVAQSLETVGGDEVEESGSRRPRPLSRRYKIQDVIKRRQILLVQVTKEERGNKGAALTTYLSLAGRYCVLMPNTDRGGGVSRKITNAGDRKRLKTIIEDLELPAGMAVIVRTAGSERSKPEVKRDFEYLIRLWDDIRELTLRSTAPALIYEEANLIKRAIRDLYSRDIEDVQVEGDEAYKAAKSFMRMLTPSHAKRVQQYKDPTTPLFTRYQIESQLDAIHNPVVQLKSGGYIVINQTEALVAIDVNSGRATRERNIEETAAKTNLEASDEIARQLRLRDLAGLVVIDYIDMDESRHNAQVERRLKDAMRHDRARIQLGRISPFGLLELSRQRLRPSLFEASTEVCRLCRGTGHVRSTESTALHVLRSIDEEGARQKSAAITVSVPAAVALFILNHKRQSLAELEIRQGFRIYLGADETLVPPEFRIERLKALAPGDAPPAPIVVQPSAPVLEDADPEIDEAEAEEEDSEETSEPSSEADFQGTAEDDGAGRGGGRHESGRHESGRHESGRGDSGRGDGGRDGPREASGPDGERRGRRRRRRRGRDRDRHGGDGQREGHRDGSRDGQRDGQRDHNRNGGQQSRDPALDRHQDGPSAATAGATEPGEFNGGPDEGGDNFAPQDNQPGRPDADGGERRRRRRGRRGGRRRRRGGEAGSDDQAGQDTGGQDTGSRERGGEHRPEPGNVDPASSFAADPEGPGRGHDHWPEQRPMTPADFDRPYVDEATERFVEQSRPEPKARPEVQPEIRHEPRAEPKPVSETPPAATDDKSSGERKRGGWWKRVLS
ncbi:MAG TPA: Rne/Rng family ribonuclease [Dongiaceae bacterium]